MVVVKINMWPLGDEEAEYTLGEVRIWNVGGTSTVGNYKYKIFDKGGKTWKTGTLNGFPRTKLLAADLLYRVLDKAIGDRNR